MSDAPLKFAFDRQFESTGSADPVAPLVRRKLNPEEVEAVRQEAFAAGQTSAEAEAQRRIAASAETLAAAAGQLGEALTQERAALVADAAALAVLAAKRLAAGALAHWPEAEIVTFAQNCLTHLRSEPRLVLSTHPDLEAALATHRDELGDRLEIKADPGLTPGDAHIDWGSGSARLERAEAEAAIDVELEAFLTASGAPQIPEGSEDG